jgi:hypothetical protein
MAVTGQQVAPPLFGTLSILGRDKSLRRMDKALSSLATLIESEREAGG